MKLVLVLLLQLHAATAYAKGPVPVKPTARRAVGAAAPPVMSAGPIATSAAVFGAANAVGFFISVGTNWHYHLDLIGTGVFAISALVVCGSSQVHRLSAGAVSIWAVKLASFLFYRALQVKRDARLETLLATTKGAASFWCVRTYPAQRGARLRSVSSAALSPCAGSSRFCGPLS